ncbi:hypothetical protein C0J52_01758 [Blattella germanica]|nr:hypothetical protein C0J52_01758 [Blattella germanica]
MDPHNEDSDVEITIKEEPWDIISDELLEVEMVTEDCELSLRNISMASTSKNTVNIADPNFENVISQWVNDVDDIEDSDAEAGNDSDPDHNSEHDSGSELDISSSDEGELSVSDETIENDFYGRNRYKWSAQEPTRNVRTPANNIKVHLPGIKGNALRLGRSCTPLQIWECIFSEDMLLEVLARTNEMIKVYRSRYADEMRTELRDTTVTEMRAFIGLLYYTGIFKSSKENLESLFATDDQEQKMTNIYVISVRKYSLKGQVFVVTFQYTWGKFSNVQLVQKNFPATHIWTFINVFIVVKDLISVMCAPNLLLLKALSMFIILSIQELNLMSVTFV